MKKKFLIIISIVLLITIFICYVLFISTKKIEVKEYKITSSKLNDDYYGLKIVHFGDIHLNNDSNLNELENLVDNINLTKPDIVIFTGDLFKNDKIDDDVLEKTIELLKKIDSKLGKFAIEGDEDNYINYPSIIRKADFTYLNQNYELIYNSKNPILISDMDSDDLTQENSIYNILIKHKPDDIKNININKYDIIFAGHSHNGEIKLPFIGPIIKKEGSKTYYDEHYNINDKDLYITSGIGNKLGFRFNNRPSFNLYRFVNK